MGEAMTTFNTDPPSALRATVTASSTGGVQIATTSVTVEPGVWPLAINKGQTWSLYAKWLQDSGAKDMSAGTVSLTARTASGGSTVLSVTATGGTGDVTLALSATETAALSFVRARYVLDYAEAGTVTRLLTGPLDLENAGLA